MTEYNRVYEEGDEEGFECAYCIFNPKKPSSNRWNYEKSLEGRSCEPWYMMKAKIEGRCGLRYSSILKDGYMVFRIEEFEDV